MTWHLRRKLATKKFKKDLRLFGFGLVFLLLVNIVMFFFVEPLYILIVDCLLLIIFLSVKFTNFFFYLMLAVYPFVNWQFVVGEINVPYVDILAMLVFVGWLIKKLLKEEKFKLKDWPGLLVVSLFFIASGLSLINSSDFLLSLKYLFRPIIFFYLMFVVLPVNLIKTEKQLKISLKILVGKGLAILFSSVLAMFVFPTQWGIERLVPWCFGGFCPLGGNHNAVAEVLIVTLPLLIIFFLNKKITDRLRAGLFVCLVLTVLGLIFTYSRSGWLVLLLQFIVLFVFRYKIYFKKHKTKLISLLIISGLILSGLYFYTFHQLGWVQSSNESRFLLTEIAWYNFLQHPVIGNGLNTFTSFVGSTFVYVVEFWDPLDSHGFLQKIALEMGLFGLITFISFLIYLIRKFLKAYQKIKDKELKLKVLLLFILFIGVIVFQLFSTSYYLARVWLPIGVALAGLEIYKKLDRK